MVPSNDLRRQPRFQDNDNDDDDNTQTQQPSLPPPNSSSSLLLMKKSYSLIAAAEMARIHFNERNTVLVPELANLDKEGCNIMFSDPSRNRYLDSGFNRLEAVSGFLSVLREGAADDVDRHDDRQFCAMIGPIESKASEGVSVLTEQLHIPQVAYATIDMRLGRKLDFPTFVRVIPDTQAFANALGQYVQGGEIWKRKYLAVVFEQTDYGAQFSYALQATGPFLGYKIMAEDFTDNKKSMRDTLKRVAKEGFRTIAIITTRMAILNRLAEAASDQGLLGPDYFWIISGEAFPPALVPTLKHEVDSPIDRILRGATIFTNYDRFAYKSESDPFLQEWRRQDQSTVDVVNEIVPSNDYVGEPTYFQDEVPTEYASFMYDSVILTGISACEAQSSGINHTLQTYKTTFTGASGHVWFDKGSNTRNATNAYYGMYNVRPTLVGGDSMQSYEAVLTAVHENGRWVKQPGTEHIFFDGTSNEPMPFRTVKNAHYLSRSVQVTGLVATGAAVFVCLASGGWVFLYRKSRVIRASQPEFVYLLCFGAVLFACSSVFVAFDEDKGFTKGQLSTMCAMYPWFFILGYLIMYCALFCKLWRLSKLLQLRRRVVTVKHGLIPFVLLMTFTVGVLILWQIMDPPEWHRLVIKNDPLETYGECRVKDNRALKFLLPFGVLFTLTMTLTAVFSWKMKDVQDELSESKWILHGIIAHLQLWAVGLPIIFITIEVSRDASFLMTAALSFCFPVSLVTLVIWPKIFVHVRNEYFGDTSKSTVPTISIVGSPQTRVSGLSSAVEQPVSSPHLGGSQKDSELLHR